MKYTNMDKRVIFGKAKSFDRKAAEQTRTIPFIASTSAKDRHGTVVNQENWQLDAFNANGIVGYMHNVYGDACNPPNPDDVIGSARAWIEEGQLLCEITFEEADNNPLAEKVFRKVLNGILKAVSVGFSEVGTGKWGEGEETRDGSNPTYYFGGQELLEISVVNIPSNPEALRRNFRNHSANALMYLHRAFNGSLTFAEIERLTVRDILNKINGVEPENKEVKTTPVTDQMKRRATFLARINN